MTGAPDLYRPGILYRRDPVGEALPVVFDSPHSGREMPPDFAPIIGEDQLRTGEDAHVDRLFADAPAGGAALLAALFPRTYIDPNRAVDEIDPALLAEPWPAPLRATRKTAVGMGLIRRNILPGVAMYDRKLDLAAVRRRIEHYYLPYHRELQRLIDRAHAAHGAVWHVNCHSMKPVGNRMNEDADAGRPDFVLGDLDGSSCDPRFTDMVAGHLADRGYGVARNRPFKGQELIRRHGRPAESRHALQIEINRALYMNGEDFQPHAGFEALRRAMAGLAAAIGDFARAELARAGRSVRARTVP